MFRSFIAWLDNYTAEEEPSSLLKSLIGLLSFSVVLGAIVGSVAIKAGVLLVGLLIVILSALALLADRRQLNRAIESNQRTLDKYASLLQERLDWSCRIASWEQTNRIQANGDTTQVVTVSGVAMSDRLDFFRLTVGAGWRQPRKYRNKASIEVRGLDSNGRPGPRCDIITSWGSDDTLLTIVHLPQALDRGQEFRIQAKIEWPGKCRPLVVDREGEDFCVSMRRDTDMLRYSVILPEGMIAYCRPVGFNANDTNFSLSTESRGDVAKYSLEVSELPAFRRVGIRLEVEEARRRQVES
jgi:hypothetical protein